MIGNEIANITEGVSLSSRIYGKILCMVKTITVIEKTKLAEKASLEVEILRDLKEKHPNIMSVFQILENTKQVVVEVYSSQNYKPAKCEASQIQYDIIMPYFRRGSLQDYLKILNEEDGLEGVCVEIFRQVLLAARFLHGRQYVHGSIKPDNILLDDEGNVKLIDFGDSAKIDDYHKVSPVDDFQFFNRPLMTQTFYLYNYLRGFDEGGINESKVGLLSLFRQLFLKHQEKHKHLEFYNYMYNLYSERNQNITELLLQHPFLADPKNRTTTNLLFQSKKIPKTTYFHPIKEKLSNIYSQLKLSENIERKNLYIKLINLTKNTFYSSLKNSSEILERYANLNRDDFSKLTTQPLLGRPPKGFHHLYIEFAMNKSSPDKIKNYIEKMRNFGLHIQKYPRILNLKQSVRAAKEVYEFAKYDQNPTSSLYPMLQKFKGSCLSQLWLQNWKIERIFGDENPITPRAYIALNISSNQKPQVIVVFVGASILPYPLETWWTNDIAQQQSEIWSKVNFVRSAHEHTGIKRYAEKITKKVKAVLIDVIPPSAFKNIEFELIGHSTGGVLAIAMGCYLKSIFSENRINIIGFGTPNFLTRAECIQLNQKFPNDDKHSFFNLIDLHDPALGIYGQNLVQPEENTIFYVPKDFSGNNFINIHAASQGTTKAHIKLHFPEHYQSIVEDLCRSFSIENRKKEIRARL